MKLAPMIQALSRAVAAFSKSAEAQAKAVDASLEQTEVLSNAITMLLAEMRNAEIARADAAAAAEARRPYKPRSTARGSDPGLQPSLWSDVDKRDDG